MIEITDLTFEKEVLQSPIPVLVDFYANWCSPCKAAAPIVATLDQEFNGRVKVMKLNVDTGSENAVKYGVRGIPNFVIFKNGQLVHQVAGFHETLDQDLRSALNGIL